MPCSTETLETSTSISSSLSSPSVGISSITSSSSITETTASETRNYIPITQTSAPKHKKREESPLNGVETKIKVKIKQISFDWKIVLKNIHKQTFLILIIFTFQKTINTIDPINHTREALSHEGSEREQVSFYKIIILHLFFKLNYKKILLE